MNGRLYDPLAGRFLSADPYVQDGGLTQSYNRYTYCLNNPLKFTDPSGNKWHWKWLSPLYWFGELMQTINDNTKGLRKKMADAGIPDFNVGVNVNGAGNVNYNGSYRGQEVLNTANVDRSNAVQVVNKEIVQVDQGYGQAWMEASYGGGPGWEPFVGTAGAIAGEMYYSKTYGTWMGKNFTLYKQTFHGNGSVGGMNKFGKNVSTGIKIAGYGLGIWNAYNIDQQNRSGQMNDGQMYMEQGSNLFTTVGGLHGAVWGVGWELGRAITNTGWYQEAKFNFWYDYWEGQVGVLTQSNEASWYYFYQNYKP